MNLILVAHGTRRPSGVAMLGDLAERASVLLGHPVRVAFVDVLGPTPREVLTAVAGTGRTAVVLPAFLSRGYHVGTDLPAHIAASRHPEVVVTPSLGPGPQLTAVVAARLAEAGRRPGDSVVLAGAGSSDPMARADLAGVAAQLATRIGSPVELAFAATGTPGAVAAVAAARGRGARRVIVASYLLSDGVFQQRLRDSGADLVTEPLGAHDAMARLVADRFAGAGLISRGAPA